MGYREWLIEYRQLANLGPAGQLHEYGVKCGICSGLADKSIEFRTGSAFIPRMGPPENGSRRGYPHPYRRDMDVTFTKAAGRRYTIKVVRSVGVELAERGGPGYDPYLPHDVVHFVAEAEAGIRGGVFGRLAAGDNGIFWPADQRELRRQKRRQKTPTPEERADMARSERLAGICPRVWAGHTDPADPADLPDDADRALIERICTRLGEVAERWHALPVGGEMTLTWPYGEGRRKPRAVTTSVRARR
jgi:hypothetical protein